MHGFKKFDRRVHTTILSMTLRYPTVLQFLQQDLQKNMSVLVLYSEWFSLYDLFSVLFLSVSEVIPWGLGFVLLYSALNKRGVTYAVRAIFMHIFTLFPLGFVISPSSLI
jgi:hypothetical protein